MKTFNIINFIADLQDLTPTEAIHEIGASGLTNNEIAFCIKAITFNDTFRFKK